jgi:anti-sigma-K factor RskA
MSDRISRIVQRMKPEPASLEQALVAERSLAAGVSRPHMAWRALGDWRAVLAGTAVLGAAVLLGPLEAGVVGFAVYRVLRPPLPALLTDEEALAELSGSVLHRIGKRLVAVGSVASFATHAIEIGGIVYFGYRIVRRWRAHRRRRRRAQTHGAQP